MAEPGGVWWADRSLSQRWVYRLAARCQSLLEFYFGGVEVMESGWEKQGSLWAFFLSLTAACPLIRLPRYAPPCFVLVITGGNWPPVPSQGSCPQEPRAEVSSLSLFCSWSAFTPPLRPPASAPSSVFTVGQVTFFPDIFSVVQLDKVKVKAAGNFVWANHIYLVSLNWNLEGNVFWLHSLLRLCF